ncbi:MAG: hypothetical protein IT429_18340 [Gemmataceae bacterium]|nr:hypothetical protein [Gemmataceae bacterium]
MLVVPGPNDELQITDETRVLLNGRPCRYRDVPAGAIVIGVELAADQRTVLTIQFRTR